jgi:hypothetical protein
METAPRLLQVFHRSPADLRVQDKLRCTQHQPRPVEGANESISSV